MLPKTNIMLVGRSSDALSGIYGLLEDQRLFSLQTHVIGNGHGEPWGSDGQNAMPHAFALCIDDDWRASLPGMLQALPAIKPPFLVFSPTGDIELLRTAMRAGARDVLSPPYSREDLCARLIELAREEQEHKKEHSARLIAFINAKGGSGASFLAANVASSLASKYKRKALLIDFDLQFASMPIYLNMHSSDGLIKALEFVETLDTAALSGYVQKHDNGLHLLAASTNRLVLTDEISEERITKLLDVLETPYQDIIVDLPRRIDRISSAILERLEKVVVVSQQSVSHLHDTKRLMLILREQFGLSNDRIIMALNRFSKKEEVRASDFVNAFPSINIITIPSDYTLVSQSINLGDPVINGPSRVPLVRAILGLSSTVLPQAQKHEHKTRKYLNWFGLQSRFGG